LAVKPPAAGLESARRPPPADRLRAGLMPGALAIGVSAWVVFDFCKGLLLIWQFSIETASPGADWAPPSLMMAGYSTCKRTPP
jgi:hypothetical protein